MSELVKAEDYGLETTQANGLTSGLEIVIAERDLLVNEFKEVSKLEITESNISTFKELRLRIVKNRTQGVVKWHKANKEYFLTGGKFVDAIKNREVLVNEQMESKLMDAEKHFENLEKARIEKLNNERVELIREFIQDADRLYLADMEQDVWEAYLLTKKNAHLSKLEEERKAEAERLAKEKAEAERLESQRLENIKLKSEAEAKEKALQKERAEAKAKQDAIELKAKKEREAIEVKAQKELKIQADKEAKLRAELKSKEDAEKKAEQERKQTEIDAKLKADKLAKAPIKEKLNVWVDGFNIDIIDSELLNNDKALLISRKFEAFKKWAKSEIKNI